MAAKSILPATWDAPAEFRERLGERAGKQRAMLADGHLLLVLHRPPQAGDHERTGRLIWRKPDGVWQSNDLGAGSGALFRHLGEFADRLDRFDKQEDEAAGIADYFAVLEGVTPLHRTARNLYATLQDAREKLPGDRDLVNARDRAYEIERQAELLLADARHSLELAMARKSEEQTAAAHQMAAAAYRLNLLVALFFPIATLSAVFGANLDHWLERFLPPPFAFLAMILAGLILGIGLAASLGLGSKPARDDAR